MLKTRKAEPAPPQDPTLDPLDDFEAALGRLNPFLSDPMMPADVLINPLLGLWDAAHVLGDHVAQPLQVLLTVLIRRHLIPTSEVHEAVEETRARAVEAVLLAVGGSR